jgi:hypothetical protein
MPAKVLPNWALAGVLAAFVGGTYFYSMHAVGTDDLRAELEAENKRQAAQPQARQ